jgi:hypothetical protein
LTALHVHDPAEHVEALILAGVSMSRRPAVDGQLRHGDAPAGRPARRLHLGRPARHSLTRADDVARKADWFDMPASRNPFLSQLIGPE